MAISITIDDSNLIVFADKDSSFYSLFSFELNKHTLEHYTSLLKKSKQATSRKRKQDIFISKNKDIGSLCFIVFKTEEYKDFGTTCEKHKALVDKIILDVELNGFDFSQFDKEMTRHFLTKAGVEIE